MCLTCNVHEMQIRSMKLATYLETQNLSDVEFASLIGRDRTTVMRLRRGDTKPDWKTLEEISRASNGAVTPNDFLEDSERHPNKTEAA